MSLVAARRWLKKAAHDTADFGGGGEAPLLAPEQFDTFIRIALTPTAVISRARRYVMKSHTLDVPRIGFNGVRVLKRGSGASPQIAEGAQAAAAMQSKPTTANVTLIARTYLGEVQMTREVLQDNIEGEAYADTVATELFKAVGRDLEEVALKSKAGYTDELFAVHSGLVDQMDTTVPGGQISNQAGNTDVITLFDALIELMPVRYRTVNPDELVLFVPQKVLDAYVKYLRDRGTVLGDEVTKSGKAPKYRGYDVVAVPLLSGTEAGIGNFDFSKVGFFTHPANIIYGVYKDVEITKFEWPLTRSIYFIPYVRFDARMGEYDAVTFTKTIDSI